MYVIPAVDMLNGKVVRLRRGSYEDVTTYGDDPARQLTAWGDQGARIVHVVDLAGARDGTGDENAWRRLGATGVPFQMGGGIRTRETAEAVVAAGASRVVLGTAAVWEPDRVAKIVAAVGAERVVAAIDVRGGMATGAGWRDEGRALDEVLADLADAGVIRALATGIATDGTLDGPDVGLLERVIAIAPQVALIASGGVGTLADLSTLRDLEVEAAIVGRALYDGRFTFAEAVRAASG